MAKMPLALAPALFMRNGVGPERQDRKSRCGLLAVASPGIVQLHSLPKNCHLMYCIVQFQKKMNRLNDNLRYKIAHPNDLKIKSRTQLVCFHSSSVDMHHLFRFRCSATPHCIPELLDWVTYCVAGSRRGSRAILSNFNGLMFILSKPSRK
jgi:hypothetical protein